MSDRSSPFDSAVFDVDGVLWIAGALGEGTINFFDNLRKYAIPFCLLTNDCSVSKAERYEALTQAGLSLHTDQLVTVADATREWLINASAETIMYLGAPSTLLDIAQGFDIRESGPVDAVVVGDLFAHYDRRLLDMAARAVDNGAILVAMQRNARWSDGKDWYIDNGFWVAGLEYVTGKQAVVTGKPNQRAYLTAVSRLKQVVNDYSHIAFVSDDALTDLKGAKDVGLTTIYFGQERVLPTWVDYSVRDVESLTSLIIGRDHD